MEVTEEQLNQLVDKAVENKLATMVNRPKRQRPWNGISDEIEDHLSHYGQPKAYQLKTAINTILRLKLDVSNVYQISSESQIEEARDVVEQLKKII